MKPILPPAAPKASLLPLVLYVEDEDDNWAVTELRLAKHYRLVRAENDQRACDGVRMMGPSLLAILMDIQLKGSTLDGVRLTQMLRGKLAADTLPPYARGIGPIDTPIVFVTAYGASYREQTLLDAGGNAVVPKPVDFLKLTLTLANFHAAAASAAMRPKPTGP